MVRNAHNRQPSHGGFTLVELLVVIAVIGILISLLMPAIQSSREAARKTQCKNQLRQMGVAFLGHESAHGFFPSSGWGNRWVGDPDGGFGATQPGGWAYSILPYMEQQTLFDSGNRMRDLESLYDFEEDNDPDEGYFLRLVTTVVPQFNCPSKRPAELYPMHSDPILGQLAYNVPVCWYASGCRVARGDYRVNSGNVGAGDMKGPPMTFARPWYPAGSPGKLQNGISYMRSTIRISEITDGTSKTAMLGEKYQDPDHYFTGADGADNQCVYSGHNSDNNGYTGTVDDGRTITFLPMQDHSGRKGPHHFGSNHDEGLHMAYSDGSVHFIDYAVAERVWYVLGGRNDGTN